MVVAHADCGEKNFIHLFSNLGTDKPLFKNRCFRYHGNKNTSRYYMYIPFSEMRTLISVQGLVHFGRFHCMDFDSNTEYVTLAGQVCFSYDM